MFQLLYRSTIIPAHVKMLNSILAAHSFILGISMLSTHITVKLLIKNSVLALLHVKQTKRLTCSQLTAILPFRAEVCTK